jgi:ankyrin repeat protein/beta-lactamase regulating signal transducer with metallopeptidase domain
MNPLLSGFLSIILELSLHGSLALLVVVALRFLTGKHLAPRYRSFLWFPALLAFLIPVDFLPENPFALPAQPVVVDSLATARTYWKAEAPASITGLGNQSTGTGEFPVLPLQSLPEQVPVSEKSSIVFWLALAWLSGALLLLCGWWRDSSRFWRQVALGRKDLSESTLKVWAVLLEEQQLRYHLRLICSYAVEVPVLAGFWKPCVILPADQEKYYSEEILGHIFRHELAHFRRRDLYFLAFERVVLLMHWFNPLLWFSHRLIRGDRELGADAAALDGMSAGKEDSYGQALLQVAAGCGEQDRPATAVGIFENKKQLAERLRRITSHRRTGWIAGIGAVAVLSLVCFLVFGRGEDADIKPYASLSEDQALIQASMEGDLPVVRHYLKTKPDLNRMVDWTGPKTALAAAASRGQIKAMKLLLQAGADPNFKPDGKSWTAVESSIKRGRAEATELLLKNGAIVEENMLAAYRGDTAHFRKIVAAGSAEISFDQISKWTGIAAVNNRMELYKLMLETGKKHPQCPSWNYPGEGDMATTIARGHKDILQETLDSYPEGLERFKDGPARVAEPALQCPGMKEWLEARGFKIPPYTPGEELIDAAGRNDLFRIKQLLDQGVDPNYSGEAGWSPVVKAANSNKIEAVKLLLSRGGNPNSVKSPGWNYSALTLCENPKIADVLFEAGADVNAKLFKRDVHIVSYQITFGHTAMVQWFVSKGVDLKTAKGDEPTLLFDAGNAEVAKILIDHGIDPNVRDKNGQTALHEIAGYKEKPAPALKVLLENGANPNVADSDGYTPLMAAKDGESVEILLKHGANPNAKTKAGMGVLESTSHMADVSRLKMLLKHGFKLDAKTSEKLLSRAADSNQADIVGFLLDRGVNANAKIKIEQYPGVYYDEPPINAAMSGHVESLKLLLDHGGNPQTGMMVALMNGKKNVVKLLWEHGARNIPESTYLISQGAALEELKSSLEKEGKRTIDEKDFFSSEIHSFVYACKMNRKEVVDYLWPIYQTDASVTQNGMRIAAGNGGWQVVDFLLDKGIAANPGMLAAAAGNANPYREEPQKPEDFVKTVELLIGAGALQNASAEQRGNVMMAAVFTRQPGGNEQVIRQLLAAGLNGNEKVKAGKPAQVRTVLEMIKESCEKGYCSEPKKKIIELLEASVATPAGQNKSG